MKILTILKKKKVYIPLILVLMLVGGFVAFGGSSNKNYETAVVSRGDFQQEVSVTGKVKAAEDVDLSFQASGKVSRISVDVGSKVVQGQALAYLDSGETYASLVQAQARLDAENVKLAQLQRGSRAEDINITQSSYDQAKNSLVSSVADAYSKSDDAIRSQVDKLYNNPTSANPDIIYFSENNLPYEFRKKLNDSRIVIGENLNKWLIINNSLQTGGFSESGLTDAKTYLYSVRDFLNNITLAVNALTPNSSLSQASIDAYKSGISGARSSVGGAITTLNASEQSFRSASASLGLKKAGADPEDIRAQQANVQSAGASVLQQQSLLSKYSIRAPFSGTITKNDLKLGQSVGPTNAAFTIISNANFEIESFIPEADIAKIKIGDKARVTLDAYGDSVLFDAVVSQIDLSDTQVEGVSTYKTVLQFEKSDDKIKSGMTANVDIQNETRTGVLNVPQGALINTAGVKTVLVLDQKNKTTSKVVKTGTLDGKGNIEIIEGVSEGDKVVTNPAKK